MLIIFSVNNGCWDFGEGIGSLGASLVAQMVKNLPAMWKTWVWSLGQEDPLEKGMATHSSFLPWEIHGPRNLAGYSPCGRKESDVTERLTHFFHLVPLLQLADASVSHIHHPFQHVYTETSSPPLCNFCLVASMISWFWSTGLKSTALCFAEAKSMLWFPDQWLFKV